MRNGNAKTWQTRGVAIKAMKHINTYSPEGPILNSKSKLLAATNKMRLITFLGAIFASLVFSTGASASLITSASSTTDLSNLNIGDTFVVNIVISTTAPEATALGMRAGAGAGLAATGNYFAPASIFNFSPSVPFGGIANTPALLGLDTDGTVNLFQGSSLSAAAGAGPDSFSVEFMAVAGGAGTITIGQVAGHTEDVYVGGDNVYNNATLAYSVNGGTTATVPDGGATLALTALGLLGVGALRRRKA